MESTGVTVLIRSTGDQYGMHAACAGDLISQLIEAR